MMRSRETMRWIVGVAATCALAFVGFYDPHAPGSDCYYVCDDAPRSGLRRQEGGASLHAYNLRQRLRELDLEALVARVVPRDLGVGEPFVWFAPDVPDPARTAIRQRLARDREARGAWHGRFRTALIVVTDTASVYLGIRASGWPNGSTGTLALLPRDPTKDACIAVLRLRDRTLTPAGIANVATSPTASPLDACAFFDAFGPPGPTFARSIAATRAAAFRAMLPALPDSARRQFAAEMLAENLSWRSDIPRLKCSAGFLDACEAGAFATLSDTIEAMAPRPPWQEFYDPHLAPEHEWARPNVFSRTMDIFLAELGPERFAKFWSTDRPAAEAYRAIALRPVESFVHEYGDWRYWSSSRPRYWFGRHGPPQPTGIALSVVLLAASIGAGVAFASRRALRPTVT